MDFHIRSDSVDVEEIMRQIRARIRDKRGVDYTEQQIQELAAVKLEKFLDPKGVRSDLLEQFRRGPGAAAPPPNYAFEDTTLFESNRSVVRFVRKLLQPVLKLFFNPNPLIQALHIQSNLNTRQAQLDARRDALYYEVMHNLVVEMTRLGIEVKNIRMRVESVSSRLDFNERRARALEGVVQYKPAAAEAAGGREALPAAQSRETAQTPAEGAAATRSRRRRRRRGRRTGSQTAGGPSQEATAAGEPARGAAVPAGDQPIAAPEQGAPEPQQGSEDRQGPPTSDQ